MLGHKARDFRQHVSVSLDDLVSDDNFYRMSRIASISASSAAWPPISTRTWGVPPSIR